MGNKEILQTLMATGNGNIISVGKGRKKTNGRDTGKPCLVVGVKKKKSKDKLAPEEIIPSAIGNNPQEIDVIEMGEIVAL